MHSRAVLLAYPLAVSTTVYTIDPHFVGQIPPHGFANTGLEGFFGLPAQPTLNLSGGDGLATIVAGAVFNVSDLLGIALSLLLLATPVHQQLGAPSFVRAHMQIKSFMTHWQLNRDLLWAPLQSQQHISLALDPSVNLLHIATALRTSQGKLSGLLGVIPKQPFIASKLSDDRVLVAPKLISNLCNALVGFYEAVNLIFIYLLIWLRYL